VEERMEKTSPVFVYDNNRKENCFIRAKLHDLEGCSTLVAFPDYTEKTKGLIVNVPIKDMDLFYDYPDGKVFIRVLMEVFGEKEEMMGYAWVYVAHPHIIKYKSLGQEE
jgi:hypothetical protein